ncbi:MAG TPA: hypothetical protein VGM90_16230 [Kofleriaceae bacterium]
MNAFAELPPADHTWRTIGLLPDPRAPSGCCEWVPGDPLAAIVRVASTCACGWRSPSWIVGRKQRYLRTDRSLYSGTKDETFSEALWWRHLAYDVLIPLAREPVLAKLARLQQRSHGWQRQQLVATGATGVPLVDDASGATSC